jgi:flavin-binding protein dodecin
MSVAKIIELVGESEIGWEDAVKNAVRDASQTVDNITGVEILNLTANVTSGDLLEYKANVKLAFGVQDR